MLNEHIFDNIDTKDKAYWLGFLMADGSNDSKTHKIKFSQKITSKYIVEELCDFIGIDKNKIKDIERTFRSNRNKKYNGRIYKTSVIYFYSNHMSECLASYGIKSPKIDNMRLFECGNEELELSFLSGFYDGDGQSKQSSIFCKNYDFLYYIKEKYKLHTKITTKSNDLGSCFALHLTIPFRRRIILTYPSKIPDKMLLDYYDKGIITKYMTEGMTYEEAKSKTNSLPVRSKKFEISKVELEDLIFKQKKSFVAIGKIFGVSDNAIRKRAKKLGIDIRKRI